MLELQTTVAMRVQLLCFVLILIACAKGYSQEEIDRVFEPITAKYGVKIAYKIDSDFLPIIIGGARAPFDKVEEIESQVLLSYSKILQKAFEKYPESVIRDYLKAIYFSRKMEFKGGFQCAGTYDPYRRIVYLVNDGRQEEKRSISTFHHEFSSILLKNRGLLLNPWYEQNPKDFKYRGDIYEKWENVFDGTSLIGTDEDNKKGFLNSYAQTNFENDFNEYSKQVFTFPDKFKQIMNQYPRVRGKFLVWLKFYQEIDPIFTEEYLLGEK